MQTHTISASAEFLSHYNFGYFINQHRGRHTPHNGMGHNCVCACAWVCGFEANVDEMKEG